MGKLNLLHHKSWHVYSQANRDKVKRDEEKEQKRLELEANRREQAEQQAKRELLLRRANLPVESQIEKHVNLFEELEKYKDSELTKTEDEIKHQKRCDQHTWFLGETRDGKKESELWYASNQKDYGREEKIKNDDPVVVKKKSKRDERRKQMEDPLRAMKAYMLSKDTGGSSQELVGKAKRVGGTGVKTVDQLRQERIEREAAEKQRLAELLDPKGKKSKHKVEKEYFNSQFNPSLVKETKRDAGVGKTSLINSQTETSFTPAYNMTVKANLVIKSVKIPDTNCRVDLFITDVGGNDVFQEYVPKYCIGATSFALLYDSTDLKSFKSLSKWITYTKNINTLKSGKGVLIATKIDQSIRRAVPRADGEKFAKENGLAYFETSATDPTSSVDPFNFLAKNFLVRFEEHLESCPT